MHANLESPFFFQTGDMGKWVDEKLCEILTDTSMLHYSSKHQSKGEKTVDIRLCKITPLFTPYIIEGKIDTGATSTSTRPADEPIDAPRLLVSTIDLEGSAPEVA